MKVKFFAVLAALLMLGAFAVPASAQYAVTDDVIFLRVGYSQQTVTSDRFEIVGGPPADTNPDDFEWSGFSAQGEYNLNLNGILLGFGLEYSYMTEDEGDYIAQYLTPQVSAKFITAGGFYIGAGLAGKYLMAQSFEGDWVDDLEWDKKIDLWGNLMVGFIMPVSEYYYVDVQGRFGWNLTNQQFESAQGTYLGTDYDIEVETASAYDIAIYMFGFVASGPPHPDCNSLRTFTKTRHPGERRGVFCDAPPDEGADSNPRLRSGGTASDISRCG